MRHIVESKGGRAVRTRVCFMNPPLSHAAIVCHVAVTFEGGVRICCVKTEHSANMTTKHTLSAMMYENGPACFFSQIHIMLHLMLACNWPSTTIRTVWYSLSATVSLCKGIVTARLDFHHSFLTLQLLRRTHTRFWRFCQWYYECVCACIV